MVTYDFLALFELDADLFVALAVIGNMRNKYTAILVIINILLKVWRKGARLVPHRVNLLYDLIAKVCIFLPTDFVVHYFNFIILNDIYH